MDTTRIRIMNNFLTILIARCGSDRFPKKSVRPIADKPLIEWIIERLHYSDNRLPGDIVLATTANKEDDTFEKIAKTMNIDIYRHPGNENDVVGRVDAVVKKYQNAAYIFKALGDCPFICRTIVRRSWHVLKKTNNEMFLWYLPPYAWPLYGSREFVVKRSAWNRIAANATGDEREHSDLYFNRNRKQFDIVYHTEPDAAARCGLRWTGPRTWR
jgi:spore coat polysaccharide biosynthesis protein SpsF